MEDLFEHGMEDVGHGQGGQADGDRQDKDQDDLPFEGRDELAELAQVVPTEFFLINSAPSG